MTDALTPMSFRSGSTMKNRFMLSPLTNTQSHADGVVSMDEQRWLIARACGGFGAIMTAAAHVHPDGQGFPGQLGVFDDRHLPRLRELADALHASTPAASEDGPSTQNGQSSDASVVVLVQLHHAGARSPASLVTERVSPSAVEDGVRALHRDEVHQLRDAFIAGAQRVHEAGFDGVEIHAAHGYLITQFLSGQTNHRDDEYGGSFENRRRFLEEVIDGIRRSCGDHFVLGVRVSPERFGIDTGEAVALVGDLLVDTRVDFVDVSMHDIEKQAEDPAFRARPLIDYFTQLPRDGVRLGAAGRVYQPSDVDRALEHTLDFVLLGRGAIIHPDFPRRYAEDRLFEAVSPPVTPEYLRDQALSDTFINYLAQGWPYFIAESDE